MKIYLDTSDLIRLAQHMDDASREEFANWLRERGHELVLSFSLIQEVCIPLTLPDAAAVVTRLLRHLDELEPRFIAESRIPGIELQAAILGFRSNQEPAPVDPYVETFVEVFAHWEPQGQLAQLRRRPIDLEVFELWIQHRDLFRRDLEAERKLEQLRTVDRATADVRRHRENFPASIARTLTTQRVNFPEQEVAAFSRWLWDAPSRAPSVRFSYELYHQINRAITDRRVEGDIGDLSHTSCLPYVDAMTADGRIRNYLRQADRALNTTYTQRVSSDLNQLRRTFDEVV